jgi:hypothetical protein
MPRPGRSFQKEAELAFDYYLSDNYFKPLQFVSYCGQINAVRKVSPETLLEIGIGNGIVCTLLEYLGIDVTTFDINPNLKPDVVGNIIDLKKYFNSEQFDAVLCCEVLEHLPLDMLDTCLENISYVSRSAIITLPRSGRVLLFANGEIPKKSFDISIRMPFTFSRTSDMHHWEIDSSKSSSMKNILSIMNKYFNVREFYRMPWNYYHYVFILDKK